MKGDVVFSLKGSKDTFTTGKIHEWSKEGYSGYISKDMFSQMNVNKWGPTCVTLYTYDMLGNKTTGKFSYKDIEILYTIFEGTEGELREIDGKVWCNEVEKWVTPEEYKQNCKGVEYFIPEEEPDFDWENEVANAR